MQKNKMLDVILKRFETPDEVRVFEKGRFELVRLGGLTIGRATYEPGWKWSVDVGSRTGATHCTGHGALRRCDSRLRRRPRR